MDEPDNRLPRTEANKIIITYGAIAALLYIVYFFIMRMAGLIQQTEFRYLNYVLYGVAGFFALRKAKMKLGGRLSYLQGLGIGFMTGAVSFLLLGGFITLFALLSPEFTTVVLKETPATFDYTPLRAGFLVVSEGVTFSIIISLCLMQYFKMP